MKNLPGFLVVLFIAGCTDDVGYKGIYDSLFIEDMFGKAGAPERYREELEQKRMTVKVGENNITVFFYKDEMFSDPYTVKDNILISKNTVAGKDMYSLFYIDNKGLMYYANQRFKKRESNNPINADP